jgi:hypothetical protein
VNNSITGKDNIGIVDSFIRTLDLIRKYGWEYNNADKIGMTTRQIEDDLRASLDDSLQYRVTQMKKFGKNEEGKPLTEQEVADYE